jgi:hypothetical protein
MGSLEVIYALKQPICNPRFTGEIFCSKTLIANLITTKPILDVSACLKSVHSGTKNCSLLTKNIRGSPDDWYSSNTGASFTIFT